MFDLALNSNFSVHLDDRNDLATVEGREAFEQSVVIRLTELMSETFAGLSDPETVREKLRMEVHRVANEHSNISGIESLNIYQKENAPDTFAVEIVYISEGVFSTEVSTS